MSWLEPSPSQDCTGHVFYKYYLVGCGNHDRSSVGYGNWKTPKQLLRNLARPNRALSSTPSGVDATLLNDRVETCVIEL